MGTINRDLKHQLDNVHHIDTCNEIWFPKPLKIRIQNVNCDDYIKYVCIKKIGRTIKLYTENDSITLSNTNFMLQWYLYCVLLSMKDNRYSFDFNKVYEIDSIQNK